MERKKTCILIIGMHRCGSSLIGGVMQSLGYFVGKSVMPANESNLKGYYENLRCWELNEKMLSIANHLWDTVLPPKFESEYFSNKLYIHEINKIIAEDYLNSDRIVIKDPRLSLLMPFWKEGLELLGYDIRIIVAIRKPEDVARSLLERDNIQIEKSSALYALYLNKAILSCENESWKIVDYDEILGNHLVVNEIVQELNLVPNITFAQAESAILALMEASLNHSRENESLIWALSHYSVNLYNSILKTNTKKLNATINEIRLSEHSFQNYLSHVHEKITSVELQTLLLESNESELERFEVNLNDANKRNKELVVDVQNLVNSQKKIIEHQINNDSSLKEVKNTLINILRQKEVEHKEKEKELIEIIANKETYIYDVESKFHLELTNLNSAIDSIKEKLQISIEKCHLLEEELKSKENENADLCDQVRIGKEEIDQLNDIVSRKQEEIKIITQSLRQKTSESFKLGEVRTVLDEHVLEIRNIRNSVSHKLGFGITWPFRKLIGLFISIGAIVTMFFAFIQVLVVNRKSSFRMISWENLRTLESGLRNEPIEMVLANVRARLKRLEGIEEALANGTEEFPIKAHIDGAFVKGESVFLNGWAISTNRIDRIKFVNDETTIDVIYNFERDDLTRAFPDYEDSSHSGFFMFAKILNPDKNSILKIYDKSGWFAEIPVKFQEVDDFKSLAMKMDMSYLKTHLQYPIWSVINSNLSTHIDSENLNYKPLVSIITPVYNISKIWLDKCIESVLRQSYENWELCLYDDASNNQETLNALSLWENRDARIRIFYGNKNRHISVASNEAIKQAKGIFIGLLDHDDELAPDALLNVIDALNKDRDLDFIYTDEDKIDADGKYVEPHFKPSWSPETLESMMYVGHFLIFRKSLIDRIGGFRVGYEGSQDFDLVLRVTELTEKVFHIPKVLYHWRIIDSSVSSGIGVKSYAYKAAQMAINDRLERTGRKGEVQRQEFAGLYEVKKRIKEDAVTIIIPFHNSSDMTLNCLKSLKKSTYKRYNVILVSNNSTPEEYEAVKYWTDKEVNVDLVEFNKPFNYAEINNWAAKKTQAKFLLFLNNDILVISEDWIERLMEFSQEAKIGAVGAKLLYEDNTVQHAGVVMKIGGIAGHGFRFLPDKEPGYCGYAAIPRNCSAVTGACLMVRRELFNEVGGFNQKDLHVAFNDVDLCLKLLRAGYRNIYTPFAKLYHLESKTRPKTIHDMTATELKQFHYESNYMKKTYPDIYENGDKYYNVNLTLKRENYALNI